MPKRIQMSRQRPWRAENPDAVIVARPSKWGNPFGITREERRQDAVDEYRKLLANRGGTSTHTLGNGLVLKRIPAWHEPRDLRAALHELRGRDLACWCPLVDAEGNPVPCHADVLLELANGGA